MNSLEDIKIVLLDMDDTIVHSIKSKWALHKHVAKTHYEKDLSDDEILQHWGIPLDKLVCLLYSSDNSTEALAFCKDDQKDFPSQIVDGAIDAISYLRDIGMKTGVVTASLRFSYEADSKVNSIDQDLFDFIQTAEDSKYHKPDPRVFASALEWAAQNSVKAQEVLYIGDALHDYKAADSAGLKFLGVETGLTTKEDFLAAGTTSIANLGLLPSVG